MTDLTNTLSFQIHKIKYMTENAVKMDELNSLSMSQFCDKILWRELIMPYPIKMPIFVQYIVSGVKYSLEITWTGKQLKASL